MLAGISTGRLLSWCCVTGFMAAIACGDSGDDGETGEDCTRGLVGCGCIGGACVGELECVEDVCSEPGGATTNVTQASTAATAPASEDGGNEDGQSEVGGDTSELCGDAKDCGLEQVCGPNNQCGDTQDFVYLLTVNRWVPNDCQGLADDLLYYKVKVDGVVAATSEESACPGEWLFADLYKPEWALEIELWRTNGGAADSVVTRFCYLDAADSCGPVPAAVLHEGGFTGAAGDSFVDIGIVVDTI